MITHDNIILEFIPYKTLEKSYFQPIIETLLASFKNEPILQKTSVNAFIVLLGKTKNISSKIQYSLSCEEGSN